MGKKWAKLDNDGLERPLFRVRRYCKPAAATSGVSANSTATYARPSGYFPDQFVNQAKEVEPMPVMYE